MNTRRDSHRDKPTNPIAIISLVVAILGLFFFGIALGPVAIVLASMALSQLRDDPFSKGQALAIIGLVLGLMDMVIWICLIVFVLTPGTSNLQHAPHIDGSVAVISLDSASKPIKEAMEKNVIVEILDSSGPGATNRALARGSGIIVGQNESSTLMLTSRHLVEPDRYQKSGPNRPKHREIRVIFVDNTYLTVNVVWKFKDNIDLAVLSDGPDPGDIPLTQPEAVRSYKPGDRVFSVGNPMGLDWTYTEGVISGIRRAKVGDTTLTLIQTQAPVNTGNSGGGLYLMDGRLIGVITWAKPKHISEGIGLAISYEDFVRLYKEMD